MLRCRPPDVGETEAAMGLWGCEGRVVRGEDKLRYGKERCW